MSEDKWKGSPYVITAMAILLTVLLFHEFGREGPFGIKILMGVILIGLVVGAFFISRFVKNNWNEIGEARFDTTGKKSPPTDDRQTKD
ncbi:hypothetical protein [Altererythrobacter fulvus]|uniref:hypothetical protein n=1 Tax=Caenibius fulvus TaxID=2126012 RepID=UPI003017D369